MNILFMGSPEIAVPSLKGLVDSGERIVGVVSQPDKPAGRGQEIHACAVATYAREHSFPLLQPEKIRDEPFLETVKTLVPDLIVVVAYGKILPKELLDLPARKCINVHFSLLPKYRGAAPVQWALINGEEVTGVTTLYMTEQLDAGPILCQRKAPVEPEDAAETLLRRLSNIGAELLVETLDRLKRSDLTPVPQVEGEATPAPSLKKADGRLDFTAKATNLLNQIRGMNPWPGTFTLVEGKALKVFHAEVLPRKQQGTAGEILAVGPLGIEVSCGQESLLLKEVQLEGKRRMLVTEFLKGHPLKAGDKLE